MNATGKQIVVLPKLGLLDPLTDRIAGRLRYLELNRSRRLLLHHRGTRRYVVTMANVAYPHLDKVAGSQFAVEPQVEHGEFPNAVLQLKAHSNGPNFFQFER